MKLSDLKKAVGEIHGLLKAIRVRKQNGLTTDSDIKFVSETEKKADAAKSKLAKSLEAVKGQVTIKLGTDDTEDLDDFFQEVLEEGDFNKVNLSFVKTFVKKVPLDYAQLSEDRYLLSTIATDGNVEFIDMLLSMPGMRFGLVDFLSTCMYSQLHRIPTVLCIMKHDHDMGFDKEMDEVKPLFKEFLHAIAKKKYDAKNENRTGRLELIEKILRYSPFGLDADEDEGDDCQTLLSRACLEGDTLLLAFLSKEGFLREGAVNRIQSDKRTPLMNAVIGNSPETVMFLLSKGADVTIRSDIDGTAIDLCESLPGRDPTILMALKNPEKFKVDAKQEMKPDKKVPTPPSKPPVHAPARRGSVAAESTAPSTTAAPVVKESASVVSTQPKTVTPSSPKELIPKAPTGSPSKASRPHPKISGKGSGGIGELMESLREVRQSIREMDEMMVYNDEEENRKKSLQSRSEELKGHLVKDLTENYKKKRIKYELSTELENENLVGLVGQLLAELDTSEVNKSLFRLLFENVKVDWPELCEENGWLAGATSDGSLEYMQVMLSYPHMKLDAIDLITTAAYNMLYRIPCMSLLLRHDDVLKISEHSEELQPIFQRFVADIASIKNVNPKEERGGRLDLIERIFLHKYIQLDPCAETDQGQTVFSRAAFEGDYELMSRLLRIRKAPDINRIQSDQTTALIQAVFSNSPPTVALILAQPNVNVNHMSPQGTALTIGITLQRDLGIVQKLKSMGGKREEELPPEMRNCALPSIEIKKKAADEDVVTVTAENINLPPVKKGGAVVGPNLADVRKSKDPDKLAPIEKKKEVKKVAQGPPVIKKKF